MTPRTAGLGKIERNGASKIAILGFTEHKRFAPFSNPDWECWGINDLYLDIPPVPDSRLRWFQIHQWERESGLPTFPTVTPPDIRPPSMADFSGGPPHPRDANHVAWLEKAASRFPVYVLEPRAELPDAVVYPKAEVFRYFDGLTYFTNSVSYMIGLAIMELAPNGPGKPCRPGAELGVWGVDMMTAGGAGSEYGWQRPSIEWLLGWARGCGIVVQLPAQSDLLKTAFPYGDKADNLYRHRLVNQRRSLSAQRGQMTDQLNNAQMAIAELTGAINTLDWQIRSWLPGDPGEEPNRGRAPMPNAQKPIPAVGHNRIFTNSDGAPGQPVDLGAEVGE